MPSMVGKNVLHVYGRSAQQHVERRQYLLYFCHSLCCISLQHIRFHCQVGILALEIAEIVFIPIGIYLYILASQETCDLVWHE